MPKPKKAAKKTAAKKRSNVMTKGEQTDTQARKHADTLDYEQAGTQSDNPASPEPVVLVPVAPGQAATTVVPPANVQGAAVLAAPTAISAPASPRAIEGEVVPHPGDLDPHVLVDMRIRHDPRFLDTADLLPTTDPNIMYTKPKAAEPPPEPPPETEEDTKRRRDERTK